MGVTIAMENGDPHLWEYAVLKANGKPSQDLPKYHARLRISPITAQLEAVNHPYVGLTLDLAHLHLATHALGIDYLEAVEQAAPWVRHLHVNDNFGRLDVGFDSEKDRLPYGEADLHLPPGWGAIPLAEAFSRLHSYQGHLILEIKHRYWDNFGDALNNTRQLLAAVPTRSET
jgi:sugar phosphate isomerase/epimerase